jgi:hypothetical protein
MNIGNGATLSSALQLEAIALYHPRGAEDCGLECQQYSHETTG